MKRSQSWRISLCLLIIVYYTLSTIRVKFMSDLSVGRFWPSESQGFKWGMIIMYEKFRVSFLMLLRLGETFATIATGHRKRTKIWFWLNLRELKNVLLRPCWYEFHCPALVCNPLYYSIMLYPVSTLYEKCEYNVLICVLIGLFVSRGANTNPWLVGSRTNACRGVSQMTVHLIYIASKTPG